MASIPPNISNAMCGPLQSKPRTQYLFPDSISFVDQVLTPFTSVLTFSAARATSLNFYKDNVLQPSVSVFGSLIDTVTLPLVQADAHRRVHLQVDMLDHDGAVGGTQFLAVDCGFTGTSGVITCTLSSSTITGTTAITLLGSTTTDTGIRFVPTGLAAADALNGLFTLSTGNAPAAPGFGLGPSTVPVYGYNPIGHVNLTPNYTTAQNGARTLTFDAMDECGNTASFSFPITIAIP